MFGWKSHISDIHAMICLQSKIKHYCVYHEDFLVTIEFHRVLNPGKIKCIYMK